MAVRLLVLLLALVLLTQPQGALAAPAPDPPLTYRLTIYSNDPSQLAPDGSYVMLRAALRQSDSFQPDPHCAEGFIHGGRAELQVDITAKCPAGMAVSLSLWLPEGPILAYAESPLEWRRAYSEATTTVDVVVRPVSLRWTPDDPGPLYRAQDFAFAGVACPPGRPAFAEARTVTFRNARFDLPAGEYRWFESPQGSGSVVVCHGSNAGVRFSVLTCLEQGRRATTNDEQWIFDAIVASCRRLT
jgi:hypothetical protein